MKVIITIDLPDGTDVRFGDSDVPPGPEIPEAAMVVPATPAFVPQQVIPPRVNPTCPQHHTSKFVPAGTSKRTGKPYAAFWGCTERDCKWVQDAA
jgi:hypothetical protein